MRTDVYLSELAARHEVPAGHPECPERLAHIVAALEPLPVGARWVRSPRVAQVAELVRVHDAAYVDALLRARGRATAFDDETFAGPGSVDAALGAAGTCLDLVDALLADRCDAGFALVRPPGHHALPDRAMGYCLVNHVAVAAAHARAAGVERVAIVDWDAHLGNGTQAAFRADPSVLVIDLHQDELFPPGGAVDDTGTGAARGTTVNVPLPSGSTAEDYLAVLEQIVAPALARHRPGLVLVSCGFDAASGDPQAGMDVAPAGFADLAGCVAELARRHGGGRLGLVLEGGYALAQLGACARGVVERLARPPRSATRAAEASPPVAAVIAAVHRALAGAPHHRAPGAA